MNYYEIRDRVPCSEIDALTVEAARVWLERNGWTLKHQEPSRDGLNECVYYENGGRGAWLIFARGSETLTPSWALGLIEAAVLKSGKRAHVVIAEIRAIAEWQKRCKEWVAPKEGENCSCWECAQCRRSAVTCPTCGNKRCPRATDHRNECSGSNEPGQVGSRYA